MIVCGYQGIGKSSIANPDDGIIDLESGNFWANGRRPEEWYIYYCQIAEHLSRQGFTVLLSSHEVVRSYLKVWSDEVLILVFPALELKDKWIDRLANRYIRTGLSKDFKTLECAKDKYEENIKDLKNCGIPYIMLPSMDYDLKALLARKEQQELQKKIAEAVLFGSKGDMDAE